MTPPLLFVDDVHCFSHGKSASIPFRNIIRVIIVIIVIIHFLSNIVALGIVMVLLAIIVVVTRVTAIIVTPVNAFYGCCDSCDFS